MTENIIVKTTPSFERDAKKLLTDEAREDLFDFLQMHPEAGPIIPGTGGVRKIRWKTGKNNKGKSYGVRILYHYSYEVLIILIALYSKSDKDNITKKDRNELKQSMPSLIAKYSEDIENG